MAQWTVKTFYKKSCEQHEYFYNRKIPGAKIVVKDGFRSAEFTIETTDDEFPQIEFTEVPGGDGKTDSVDLFNISGSNIEDSEMIEMFDGGCWGDIDIEGVDEDEEARLRELIEEEGSYALEEDGEGNWYISDTECWVWGPLEITSEDGVTRIITADADGNMVDFDDEE